jgi:hypothetical protein
VTKAYGLVSVFFLAWLCAVLAPPVLSGGDAASLPSPDHLGRVGGGYLGPLTALRQMRGRYETSPQWRDLYSETIGTDESFVGDDDAAIADYDRKSPPPTHPALPTTLRGYRPVDARREILALAATHHVIFINEAHHVPMDRAFTLSLLQGLYRRGFRYFAAEALDERDAGLQSRGYPTQATGYYTKEPVFGALVRTALHIGFRVVPYEYRPAKSPSLAAAADPIAEEEKREEGEAENLCRRILQRDPHARILVHAGYAHIYRKTMTADWPAGATGSREARGTFVPMAVYFERLTGIVPLCIDQSSMMAHPDPRYEDGLYRGVVSHGLAATSPVAFVNSQGQAFVPDKMRGGYDIIVCHPPPHSRYGRPTWLNLCGPRLPVFFRHILPARRAGPILVQAFFRGEDPAQAVPADQIEVQPAVRNPPGLLLPPGHFLLRVLDGDDTILQQRPITVWGLRRHSPHVYRHATRIDSETQL